MLFSQDAMLIKCTIYGNSALAQGGGGINAYCNHLSLTYCTVAGHGARWGGGIRATHGELTLDGTIVADSVAGGDLVLTGDYSSATRNGSHILVEDGSDGLPDTVTGDPMFEPFSLIQRVVGFYALRPGSPAIDAADPIAGITTDGRGAPRPRGLGPNLGAYEVQPAVVATTPAAPVFVATAATGTGWFVDAGPAPGPPRSITAKAACSRWSSTPT
jgi:hypothetical protein